MDQRSGDGWFFWTSSKSSRSGLWKAKIASALNKIIQSSQSKKVSGAEKPKKDWFLRGRQIAFIIYDYFRVTGAHDTVFIQGFDTRWDEVPLSMSKIPSDYILESLYKFRIHESDQLKTVLELYDMDIHQKISVPNNQKLKTQWEY